METKEGGKFRADGIVVFKFNAKEKIRSIEVIYDAEKARKILAAWSVCDWI